MAEVDVAEVVVVLYGFKRGTQKCRMRHCERREWDDLTIQLRSGSGRGALLEILRRIGRRDALTLSLSLSPSFYPVDEWAMAADVVISSGSTW